MVTKCCPIYCHYFQTSNGREDQRSGSEDNISAAQSRTEHEMVSKLCKLVAISTLKCIRKIVSLKCTRHHFPKASRQYSKLFFFTITWNFLSQERLKHSAIQVLPANQADEAQIKNTLESSTGEVTKMAKPLIF